MIRPCGQRDRHAELADDHVAARPTGSPRTGPTTVLPASIGKYSSIWATSRSQSRRMFSGNRIASAAPSRRPSANASVSTLRLSASRPAKPAEREPEAERDAREPQRERGEQGVPVGVTGQAVSTIVKASIPTASTSRLSPPTYWPVSSRYSTNPPPFTAPAAISNATRVGGAIPNAMSSGPRLPPDSGNDRTAFTPKPSTSAANTSSVTDRSPVNRAMISPPSPMLIRTPSTSSVTGPIER